MTSLVKFNIDSVSSGLNSEFSKGFKFDRNRAASSPMDSFLILYKPHHGLTNSSIMLTTLPVELIHKICEPLISWRKTQDLHLASIFNVFQMATTTNMGAQSRAPSSLGNLRLICRDVNAIVSPLVFSEVVFDFGADVNRRSDASLASHLKRIASGSSPLCRYAKTLKILCLCPRQMSSHNEERRVRESIVEEFLEQNLEQAISCMKNLRYIRIEKLTKSDMMYYLKILPHISTLPLEHLYINFSQFVDWNATLPIPTLTNTLIKFKVVLNTSLASSPACGAQIRDVILANPHISDLDIQTSHEMVASHCEELLVSSPGTSSLRGLRHFSITHRFLSQDATICKGFPALRSLSLYGMDPTLPALWDNLKAADIALEELQVDSFSRPLLEYIGSFSGLKQLRMLGIDSKTYYLGPAALEEDAEHFFNVALRSHRHTLTSLRIEVNHWRPFCFGQGFEASLASCVHLVDCSLTLDYDQGVEYTLQRMMTSIASGPCSEHLWSLTLWAVTTMAKLDYPTAYWQLQRKQSCAVIRWLRNFEIREPDRYPQTIYLPQIDEVPLLTMTDLRDHHGVFKYIKGE